MIGGHGQRSVLQVRAEGAGVDAHGFASEFDEMRVGDDLQREIERRFGVTMQERTVGRQLAALGFRRLSVCPQHPKSDPQAQEAFENFAAKVEAELPDAVRGKKIEVWFQDKARVGQQGALTRIRAERGTGHRAAKPFADRGTFAPAGEFRLHGCLVNKYQACATPGASLDGGV